MRRFLNNRLSNYNNVGDKVDDFCEDCENRWLPFSRVWWDSTEKNIANIKRKDNGIFVIKKILSLINSISESIKDIYDRINAIEPPILSEKLIELENDYLEVGVTADDKQEDLNIAIYENYISLKNTKVDKPLIESTSDSLKIVALDNQGESVFIKSSEVGKVKSVNNKIGDVILKTSDLENDSDYTTNLKLNQERDERISGDNLKLDKPTTSGTTTTHPNIVGVDDLGNSAKLKASDFGKVKSVNGKEGDVILKTSDLENDSDYTTNATLTAHTSNKSNPHNVTKEQIGLGNVDNTSDLNKPISTATQTELNKKLDKPTTNNTNQFVILGDGSTALKTDFGKVDKVMGVEPDADKNVDISGIETNWTNENHRWSNLPNKSADATYDKVMVLDSNGKAGTKNADFVPYTGANKSINLNTQNFRIGGDFDKSYSTFERSNLYANETSIVHFTRLTDVASLSIPNDTTTQTDCIIITLPINISTRWVMEVDIFSAQNNIIFGNVPTKLLIGAYGISNTVISVNAISGADNVKSVSFCRDANNNNTLIIIRPQNYVSTIFPYGKVNITNFYHSVLYHADLAVKSNYKVEAVLESSLEGLKTNGTITNAQFNRDSYYLDFRNFTNVPNFAQASNVFAKNEATNWTNASHQWSNLPNKSADAMYDKVMVLDGNGKAGVKDLDFVPYTGANKSIDLNTQNLRIGGGFNKSYSTFERSYLNPNESTHLHFTRLTDVASFSRGNDTTTQSDCIVITLPIRASTQWVMEVDIIGMGDGDLFGGLSTKLLISAYTINNIYIGVTAISNADNVKSVSFCRDSNNNTIIIIRPNDNATTVFTYGKVNIANFYHSVTYNKDLAVKSNYKVEAVLESSLTDLTTNGTITNAKFNRDSYYLDFRNFTNVPNFAQASNVFAKNEATNWTNASHQWSNLPDKSADATYNKVMVLDADGKAGTKDAGDLGKNFSNTDLEITENRKHTGTASVELAMPMIYSNPSQQFSGLTNKSTDATYNLFPVFDSNKKLAYTDSAYYLLKNGLSKMTIAQNLEIAQILNGGRGSSGTMSVNLVSPPIIQNRFDSVEYVLLRGSNLYLDNTNYAIEILDESKTNVVATIPQNQVQLYADGTQLIFYYNFYQFLEGKYFIRLTSGSKVLITTLDLTIVQQVQDINVDNLVWESNYASSEVKNPSTSVEGRNFAITTYKNEDENQTPVISYKTSEIFAQGEDFYIELNLTVSAYIPNTVVGSNMRSYIGLGYSSSPNSLAINSLINVNYRPSDISKYVLYNNLIGVGNKTTPHTSTIIFIKTGNLFRTIVENTNHSTTLSNNSGYSLFINIPKRLKAESINGQITKAFKFN